MLFIRLTTTKILTLKQEKSIQESIGKLITILPHHQDMMIHIEDNQVMYFTGQKKDFMHIECQLSCCEEEEKVKKFIQECQNTIEMITKIAIIHQNVSVFTSILVKKADF